MNCELILEMRRNMKKWTEMELEEAGYKIENAIIQSVDLSMADHGVLCLSMVLKGSAWGCVYGGYSLGSGYLGCKDEYFAGSKKGIESIMRIMDVVGCERFNDMKGKIIRVASKGWGDSLKIIGNVLEDHWFDAQTFYKGEDE